MSQVDEIISDQRSYAASAVEGANNAMAAAVNAINDIPNFHKTSYDYSPTAIMMRNVGEMESFDSSFQNQIPLPNSPEYLRFTPSNVSMPVKPEVDYSVDLPERPDFNLSEFTGVAPLMPDLTLPPSPEIIMKAAPLIENIDLGTLGDVNIPEFNAEFNETAPTYSDDLKDEFLTAYDDAVPALQNFVTGQMDDWVAKNAPDYHKNRAQLEAKLAEDMENGQALSQAFEDALYNRARSRVERERERVERDLETGHSKRGFALPPASLTAGRNKVHQASADSIAQQSTELAIERAKMEIQHKQFVMTLSTDLHKHVQSMAIQYAGVLLDINRQALEQSKEVANAVARNYELILNRYKEVSNVYAILASTYEVELEAALSNVKVFSARAEAAKIAANVDAVKLEAYAKELQFELTKVDVYKAQLDGINSVVAINKQKLDAYGVDAQVYATKVKGEESKFNAYASAIKGEESKVQLEIAKLNGYEQEIKGLLAQVKVDEVQAGIVTEFNKAEAAVHSAGIDAFRASVAGEASRVSSEADIYKSKMAGFITNSEVDIASASVKVDQEKLKLDAVTANWNVSSSENIAAGKLAAERAQSIAAVSAQTAKTFGSMAGAALSSQNSMVSISEST